MNIIAMRRPQPDAFGDQGDHQGVFALALSQATYSSLTMCRRQVSSA